MGVWECMDCEYVCVVMTVYVDKDGTLVTIWS